MSSSIKISQEVATELFPYERYESRTAELATEFRNNRPFGFVHFSDFLEEDVAREAAREFPGPDDATWTHYKHYNENKLGQHNRVDLPPTIGKLVDELNSPRFVAWLSEVIGVPGLFSDPEINGAGLHQAKRGGFLNVHIDFSTHRVNPHWQRRCNLILYLSEHWETSWNGSLELWDRTMKRCEVAIPPLFNHAVIFETTQRAPHGYPTPIACPENESRRSLHLYYYTDEPAPEVKATNYLSRPVDSRRARFLIWCDSKLVAVYSWMKRRVGFTDRFASWLLSKFSD